MKPARHPEVQTRPRPLTNSNHRCLPVPVTPKHTLVNERHALPPRRHRSNTIGSSAHQTSTIRRPTADPTRGDPCRLHFRKLGMSSPQRTLSHPHRRRLLSPNLSCPQRRPPKLTAPPIRSRSPRRADGRAACGGGSRRPVPGTERTSLCRQGEMRERVCCSCAIPVKTGKYYPRTAVARSTATTNSPRASVARSAPRPKPLDPHASEPRARPPDVTLRLLRTLHTS